MPGQDSKDSKESTAQNAFVRWGVTLVGMLIVAGAVSLANRDVYSKSQVDEKIAHVREISDQKDIALQQLIQDQGNTITSQLKTIREDQQIIKSILLKKVN